MLETFAEETFQGIFWSFKIFIFQMMTKRRKTILMMKMSGRTKQFGANLIKINNEKFLFYYFYGWPLTRLSLLWKPVSV